MIKILFAKYINGLYPSADQWEDWSEYLLDKPSISRRVESKNKGAAGLIEYDDAEVAFYFKGGSPVYDAFNKNTLHLLNTNGVERYLIKIFRRKKNRNSWVQRFEGVVDFLSVEWPPKRKRVQFRAVEKLMSIGMLESISARVSSSIYDRLPAAYKNSFNQMIGCYRLAGDDSYPYVEEFGVMLSGWVGVGQQFYAPDQLLYQAGEIIIHPDDVSLPIAEQRMALVIDSWLETSPLTFEALGFYYENLNLTYNRVKIYSLDYTDNSTHWNSAEIYIYDGHQFCQPRWNDFTSFKYYEKNYFGIDLGIYEEENGRQVLKKYDGLKLAQRIISSQWPEINYVLKGIENTFPLGLDVFRSLIDTEPLGKAPLDCLKELANSIWCYVYTNREGGVTFQKKSTLGVNGTTRFIGSTKKYEGGAERFCWDKLCDAVEVTVQSSVMNASGDVLKGFCKLVKEGVSKPRNAYKMEVLPDDSLVLTGTEEEIQQSLDNYAFEIATLAMSFYGTRHYALPLALELDDNTVEWELVDNITIDGENYFFESIDEDEEGIEIELVSVMGYDYLRKHVNIPVSEENYSSSGSAGVSGSGSSGSGVIYNMNTRGAVYPEEEGAAGDGKTDDTSKLIRAFNKAKGKEIIFSQPVYKVNDIIKIDLGGKSIDIKFVGGAKILSTATLETGRYWAFWVPECRTDPSFLYPATGSAYSNNGSLFRTIEAYTFVNGIYRRISEYILMEKIDGANDPEMPVDLNGNNIIDAGERKILWKENGTGPQQLNYTNRFDGQVYLPTGAFELYNGGVVRISGGNFQFDNSSGFVRLQGPYLSGLYVHDCNEVLLEKVDTKNAAYITMLAKNCNSFTARNSSAKYGHFAGLGFTNCKHVIVEGGEYSYNGNDPFLNGYGITSLTQSGTWQDNENVTITKTKCVENKRKAIDGHGGRKVRVTENFVKGYGGYGIAWVNISDEHWSELGQLERTADVIISKNELENDADWYAGLNFNTADYFTVGIQVGSAYKNDAGSGGSWIVEENVIKNYTVYKNGVLKTNQIIHAWAGKSEFIKILNNTIDAGTCKYAINVGSGSEYHQPDIIDINENSLLGVTTTDFTILILAGRVLNLQNNTLLDCAAITWNDSIGIRGSGIRIFKWGDGANIETAQIGGNKIHGNFIYGVFVSSAGFVRLFNTLFAGTYQSGKCFDIASHLRHEAFKNAYTGMNIEPIDGSSIALPDYISAQTGEAKYNIQLSDEYPKTVNTLTIDASTQSAGSAQLEIEILLSGHSGVMGLKFVFGARVYAIDGVVTFEDPQHFYTDELYSVDNSDLFRPTIAWNGAGSERTLQVICTQPWVGYDIKIRFTGWRFIPYQKVS